MPAGDDIALSEAQTAAWLRRPVEIEEKLDGANVSIWAEGSRLQVAGRGGVGGMDRAGQLGPLRAWAAARHAELTRAIGDDHAIYGEWLWLEHSLAYEALPDHLVVLDIWSRDHGFLPAVERNERAHAAGLVTPPLLLQGVVGRIDVLVELTARSHFRTGPAEGAVLRSARDGSSQRCKWIRDDYVRRADHDWRSTRRNRLARA
jgi:hypothetical protein